VLDCLRDLTQAFRAEDKIWATNVALHENGKGTISGKAADLQTIQVVVDRLKGDKRFSDVKSPDMRESDARTHEWSFTVSFDYDENAGGSSTTTAVPAKSSSPTASPARSGSSSSPRSSPSSSGANPTSRRAGD
jgi:hypothetical protein